VGSPQLNTSGPINPGFVEQALFFLSSFDFSSGRRNFCKRKKKKLKTKIRKKKIGKKK
jgi:hypothetical protein